MCSLSSTMRIRFGMFPQRFERRLLASFPHHRLKHGKLSVYMRLSPQTARRQNTTFSGSHTAGRTGNGERLFFRQFLPLHLQNMPQHSAANLFFSGQVCRDNNAAPCSTTTLVLGVLGAAVRKHHLGLSCRLLETVCAPSFLEDTSRG